MADVSAKDVAALRKITGAGMMDCKKALEENDGDQEAAKDWLRTKGLAGASKRAGRSAEQGTVDVTFNDSVAALVELVCETDFVAKGKDFVATVAALTQQVADQGDEGLAQQKFGDSTVEETVTQLSAKLGEKIELGRVVRYETDRRAPRRLQAHPERAGDDRRARRGRRAWTGRTRRPGRSRTTWRCTSPARRRATCAARTSRPTPSTRSASCSPS